MDTVIVIPKNLSMQQSGLLTEKTMWVGVSMAMKERQGLNVSLWPAKNVLIDFVLQEHTVNLRIPTIMIYVVTVSALQATCSPSQIIVVEVMANPANRPTNVLKV